MKKHKTYSIINTIFVVLFITSCSNSTVNDSKIKKSPPHEIFINVENQEKEVMNKNFNNLVFDKDFYIEFPDTNSVNTFEMDVKPSIDGKTLYDHFDETVEKYFPSVFSTNEKKNLYEVNSEDAMGLFSDYQEKIFSGQIPTPFMWFTNEKATVQMFPNGHIHTITGAKAFELDKNTGNIAMYSADDDNTIIKRIRMPFGSDYSGDDKYKLIDKEVALADALNYTKSYLNNEFDKEASNPEFSADITDTWIVDMGDGIFGYHFLLTSVYNNIRFDTYPMKKAQVFNTVYTENTRQYKLHPGYAFMIEDQKLDSIMAYNRAYEIIDPKKYDEVITFESAVDILASEMSGIPQLEIYRAEFVYAPYYEEESVENDTTERLIVPVCWKFLS